MQQRKKVIAICGSTRQQSSNHKLIKAIAELYNEELEITLFEGLTKLPHFNPDDNNENASPEVTNFRKQLNDAGGVLICTPEYAHGVPGSLKNAIDWTVSSNEFFHKPTVLITASTDGKFAHQALLETLRVIEAEEIDQLQLLITFIQTKMYAEGKIKDEKTLEEVKELMGRFIAVMEKAR